MATDNLQESERDRYIKGMRLVSYAFIISSAMFCLVVLTIPSSSNLDVSRGVWGLAPLCGVLIMFFALQIPSKIEKSQWFLRQEGQGKYRACFLIMVLRLMLLQSAVVPAIFYFLVTGSTIWVLLLGGAGIFFMVVTMPSRTDSLLS